MLPSSLRAFSTQIAAPSCFEPVECRLDRLAGVPLLPCPPPHDTEAEQCPRGSERVSDLLVLRNCQLEEGTGARPRPPGGCDETTASGCVPQHPHTGDPRGIRLPGIDDSNGVVDASVLEKQLGVVCRPPANTRLAPPELRGPPVGLLEPVLGHGRISAPAGDEPEDGHELHGVSPELLMSKVETQLRVLTGQVELSSMDGDDRTRQLILRHLEPVLDRNVAGASRVLGTELPTSSPELDPGETPERAGASRLVPLAPLLVLAFEQRAGHLPLRGGREGVHHGQSRLSHQQLATHSAGEVTDLRGKILRRFRIAGKPTEDGLHRASLSPQLVVVELVGELVRSPCMVAPHLGARPCKPAVDDCLKRRAQRCLAEGFLEQWNRSAFGLELGEDDKCLGANRAGLCLREEIGEDTPRACPLPRAALSARRRERSTMPVGCRPPAASA